ncbi:D-2-hydroxyacid dehydrogenase [Paracoccus aurantiacus]|uniref:D-2-hydroxyacid dehydrogenase n=1 Tax=Paracoccus aurantiacus TaxID=2599412 RepID=A0A5C6RXX3_9RHOB|nr:D-2-hydroxyacid dehydrogenase [Paracoccus aurantiacus]TXB67446.1 D-2-hydroxyacid dehydrogenase [Paracoccus aurantiacus]
MANVLILDEHADWYAEQLSARQPGFSYHAARSPEEAMPIAAGAEVLIALAPRIPAELVAAMERLAWVQALTTGVDNLLAMKELPDDVALTSCGGFHGPQMSELAVMLMLASARRLPQMIADQQAGNWTRWEQPLLRDKTVCIIGLGSIAEYLAGLCGAFGMRVTGVSDGRREAPGIDRIHPRAEIETAVAEADFLVVLVPYSPRTHHIVDAAVLAAMKPSAILVNIARGGCVDEDALLDSLRAGRIAGAGLDVFATEPLPADCPFRSLPNVIVTPHIGGYADVYRQQALPIVAANLDAYAKGGIDALPLIDRGTKP